MDLIYYPYCYQNYSMLVEGAPGIWVLFSNSTKRKTWISIIASDWYAVVFPVSHELQRSIILAINEDFKPLKVSEKFAKYLEPR